MVEELRRQLEELRREGKELRLRTAAAEARAAGTDALRAQHAHLSAQPRFAGVTIAMEADLAVAAWAFDPQGQGDWRRAASFLVQERPVSSQIFGCALCGGRVLAVGASVRG